MKENEELKRIRENADKECNRLLKELDDGNTDFEKMEKRIKMITVDSFLSSIDATLNKIMVDRDGYNEEMIEESNAYYKDVLWLMIKGLHDRVNNFEDYYGHTDSFNVEE